LELLGAAASVLVVLVIAFDGFNTSAGHY